MSTAYKKQVTIGETEVTIFVCENPGKVQVVRVHENETGAASVGERLASEGAATYIDLQHTGSRNIHFRFRDKAYQFDPNRIFTHKGRVMTVEKDDGGTVSAEVHGVIEKFAQELTLHYGSCPLVALHNNFGTEYTLAAYTVGGSEYLDGGRTFLHVARGDYRNFVVTTNYGYFEKLRDRDVSVVYQVYAPESDDGSLSHYCASLHIPYCNIEAAYEAIDRQYEIARLTFSVIGV